MLTHTEGNIKKTAREINSRFHDTWQVTASKCRTFWDITPCTGRRIPKFDSNLLSSFATCCYQLSIHRTSHPRRQYLIFMWSLYAHSQRYSWVKYIIFGVLYICWNIQEIMKMEARLYLVWGKCHCRIHAVRPFHWICIWTNKMHKIPVITLYFPLDALHVSDCISPSSGATL